MKSRFRSALLGAALGDAWGYPYQMSPQPSATPLPDHLVISDDTQMTLALAAAMVTIDNKNLSFDEGIQAIGKEFLAYRRDVDYDRSPGRSTKDALERLENMGLKNWRKATTHSGGSGAVMRVSASALLAPAHTHMGWSVCQAELTHDSGVARAANAVAACAFQASAGSNLLEIATGLAGDAVFDADKLLTPEEKTLLITDLNDALIHDLAGPSVPLSELADRAKEIHRYLTAFLACGDFEELYRSAHKFVKIIGRGWDSGSCCVSALLFAQLYLDHQDHYAPHDFLHVAVNWPGNRNSRASLTGALIGAHLPDGAKMWEQYRTYEFEPRYNEAIHNGIWRGFGA